MAELTAVLSADSSQLQKALNDAKSTLSSYKNEVGKTTNITKEQIGSFEKSITALNKLNNSNKSATQQMKGLENQITNLTIQYKNLGTEAQNDKFGKALAATINEAKTRFDDLKTTTNEVKDALHGHQEQCGSSSDALSKLSEIVGVNIGTITKLGSVVGLGKIAIDEMRAAVFLNESAIDEWGRSVKAAEAAHNTFLHALNSGNWSNFFSNLQAAITGARQLYNEFDRLGSVKANNAATIASVDAELAGLRKLKKEGKDVQKQIDNALARRKSLVNEGVVAGKTANRDAIAANLRQYNPKMSIEASQKQAELLLKGGQKVYDAADKTIAKIERYARNRHGKDKKTEYIDGQTVQVNLDMNEMIAKLPKQMQSQYRTAKAVHESESGNQSFVQGWANSVQEGIQNQNIETKFTAKGGGGKSTPKKEETDLEKALKAATAALEKITGKSVSGLFEMENTLPESVKTPSKEKSRYKEDGTFANPLEELEGFKLENPFRDWEAKDIQDYQKAVKKLRKEVDKLGATQEALDNMGSAFQTLGTVIGGTGGQWVSFVGTFAQGVAQMLPQFMSLIAANEATAIAEGTESGAGLPFPANIAAIASIVAGIIGIFASLPTFAGGGILEGATSIGDYNLARVNNGEMILNGKQQKRLFNMLNNGSALGSMSNGKGEVEFVIKGKNLVGTQKNYYKKQSRL